MAMTTNRNGFTMFRISAAHYLVRAIDTADAVISFRSSFWTQRRQVSNTPAVSALGSTAKCSVLVVFSACLQDASLTGAWRSNQRLCTADQGMQSLGPDYYDLDGSGCYAFHFPLINSESDIFRSRSRT